MVRFSVTNDLMMNGNIPSLVANVTARLVCRTAYDNMVKRYLMTHICHRCAIAKSTDWHDS
jgi:hypothetical protein